GESLTGGGGKRQQFYSFAINRESAIDVYSKRRIIDVTDLKIVKWHSYKHVDWILGVKSYQKRLNLTKPDTYRSDLKRREAYTAYSNPQGFIYQNKDMKKIDQKGTPTQCDVYLDRKGTPTQCDVSLDRKDTPTQCDVYLDRKGTPTQCDVYLDRKGTPTQSDVYLDQKDNPTQCDVFLDGRGTPTQYWMR
nr:hypothetical protein [Tanacetum cinerariifolium]